MPSILFINRVYPPDSGATGRVLEHIASGFVSAGWAVTVLATANTRESIGQDVSNGIRIVRIGIPFSKKNLIFRALGYALMIPALLMKALQLPRHDVVVTKTDPPMLMVIGPLLKVLKGSRTMHWAQDLYPEVAEEVGVFRKGGTMARCIRLLSTISLRYYDAIISVGRCMTDRLKVRGISPNKIRVIPNVGIERTIVPSPRLPNRLRERYQWGNSFLVMYSGNMGRAHEFATILDSALMLQESGESDILFLFVGEGPMAGNLRLEVERRGLNNVQFIESQPEAELSVSLGAADLHLVTMRSGMEGLVVPSKFYGVVATGRHCLFVGPENAEVARVIREQGVGAVIPVGDPSRLTEAILGYRLGINSGKGFSQGGIRYLEAVNARSDFIQYAGELCRTGSISLS